jgi:hypothetical protein
MAADAMARTTIRIIATSALELKRFFLIAMAYVCGIAVFSFFPNKAL